MQITVRGLDGKGVIASVQPYFTVLDVKELICYGSCRSSEGSVSKTLHVPPPYVRLIFGCKQLDDNATLEACRVKSGTTLDLFACYLSSTQVYVQMDWERISSTRRYVPQAWTRQNGPTALHLRQWIAASCALDEADIALESSGDYLEDDFSDWESLLRASQESSIIVTAYRFADVACADVAISVGNDSGGREIFQGSREVLNNIPFFNAALSQPKVSIAADDGFLLGQSYVEVGNLDVRTFRNVWSAICSEDLCTLPEKLTADDLWDVFVAAEQLGMKSLRVVASERLQELMAHTITPDNVASWIATARVCGSASLAQAGLAFVAKHGKEVLLSMAAEDWSSDLASYECIVVAALQHRHSFSGSCNGGA